MRLILLIFVFSQAAMSATLKGTLFLPQDQPGERVEVNLKKTKRLIFRSPLDDQNGYRFDNLTNGQYELSIKTGKRETRRRIDLCCGPDSVTVVDINLNRSTPTIAVRFPLESSDVVDVREIRRDYPQDILNIFEKARGSIRSGKIGKAAEQLRKVVERAPDFYSARAMLGMLYQSVGCYQDAEREYLQTSEISPKAVQPMLNLASLYIEASRARLEDRKYLDDAIALIKKAIQIRPKSAVAYGLLGYAYFQAESYEAAEENLLKSLEKGDGFGSAHLMLANVYMRQKKWDEALDRVDIYLHENFFSPDRRKIQIVRKEILARMNRNATDSTE
jgi:tetratricopeptide (TPR) repeat protein